MQVQMLSAETAGLAATRRQPFAAALPGPFGVLSATIRTAGWRGLWRGQTGTFIRETGGCAAWFATNEATARLFDPRGKAYLSSWQLAAAGAAAGVAYNLALFPADTIKSAMQTAAEEGAPRGFWETGRAMWIAGGVRGMYAGCGITVARAAPSSAMIFLIYDGLTRRFG